MKLTKVLGLALAATAMVPLAPALAADYEPPIYVDQAPEYVPVEVGSGWYLRGDVAYTFERKYRNTSLSLDDSLFDNDLVGNFIGLGSIGPIDAFSYSEKENPVAGSIGFGYHFNDWLRADVNVGLLANDKFTGTAHLFAGSLNPFESVDWRDRGTAMPDLGCLGSRTITQTDVTTTADADGNPVQGDPVVNTISAGDWRRDCMVSASVKNSAWNGLVNGYVDLGTYAGITPYVGAGVGVLLTRTNVSATATCEGYQGSASRNDGTISRTIDTTFLCRGQTDPNAQSVTYTPISYSKTDYYLMYGLSAGLSYQISKNTSLDIGYQYINAPNIRYYSIDNDGIKSHKGWGANQVKVGLRYDLW